MQLNRSQLSLLITGFTLGIVVLTLFNIHLGSVQAEEYVIEMSLSEEDLETLVEEEQEVEETQQADVESHMAFNETAKPSFGNPEPLKTLQEILEERQELSDSDPGSDLSEDNAAFSDHLRELAQKREASRELLGEKEAVKNTERQTIKRNFFILYFLKETAKLNIKTTLSRIYCLFFRYPSKKTIPMITLLPT